MFQRLDKFIWPPKFQFCIRPCWHTIKTNCINVRALIQRYVQFWTKGLGIVFPPHLVYNFSRRMVLTLFSINWSNFIFWLPYFLRYWAIYVLRLFVFHFGFNLVFLINPFQGNVPFLYPLQTSKNQRFSDVFRRYRKGTLAWRWLSRFCTWQKSTDKSLNILRKKNIYIYIYIKYLLS